MDDCVNTWNKLFLDVVEAHAPIKTQRVKVVESGVFDLGLSDHSLVYCVLKSGRPRVAPKTIEYRSYKNYNKDSFIEDLENIP